jgi:hypothetical protein
LLGGFLYGEWAKDDGTAVHQLDSDLQVHRYAAVQREEEHGQEPCWWAASVDRKEEVGFGGFLWWRKILGAEGEIGHVARLLIAASSILFLLMNSSGQRVGLDEGFDRFEKLDFWFFK